MEAGEIGGALLFVLAAAAAVLAAVSTGAVDFSHPPAVGGQLDFQETISWFTGVYNGASYSSGAGAVSLAEVHELWVGAPLPGEEEKGSAHYPMVLVQIPMYNELEVYKLSIGAACELKWPKDRMIVQVLDNSTDPLIKVYKLSIGAACELKWPKDRMIVQVLDNSTDPLIKHLYKVEHWEGPKIDEVIVEASVLKGILPPTKRIF
ncbi:hypothetical protein TRIUR3_18344 [Triticum urartu]|uniref:Glycosyltransferase 2-like domain-containing protein n=1 Tax=Triticum urartu TaxID=4572 RepID=M8A800_TRIUA|nr:hypothetical protein TRIUR3_18344 [Triticum urartu]